MLVFKKKKRRWRKSGLEGMNCGTHGKSEGVRNAKTRDILCPQRLEVNRLADFATAVHFGGKAVQLRQLELRGGGRIRDRNLKLEVELVSNLVVEVPARPGPARPRLVAFDVEPVLVVDFVQRHVLSAQ